MIQSPTFKKWLLRVCVWGLGVAAAGAQQELLEVDFSQGYHLGPVADQSGGITGGPWMVSGPTYDVVESPDGAPCQVLFSSRQESGLAQVAFNKALPISSPRIYFAVDIWRAGANSQGYWILMAAEGGTNTGIGLRVSKGASAPVEIYTDSDYKAVETDFVMQNRMWHRFEFEADGVLKTCNVYVQAEDEPERHLIAKDVPWSGRNSLAKLLRLSQPAGKSESKMYTNNIRLVDGVEFPHARDLNADLAGRGKPR